MTRRRAALGCFATGRDMNELREALDKAVSLCLPERGHAVHVQLEVTEEQARIHAACRPDARLCPPVGAGPR